MIYTTLSCVHQLPYPSLFRYFDNLIRYEHNRKTGNLGY
jgi:hypothetical protein